MFLCESDIGNVWRTYLCDPFLIWSHPHLVEFLQVSNAVRCTSVCIYLWYQFTSHCHLGICHSVPLERLCFHRVHIAYWLICMINQIWTGRGCWGRERIGYVPRRVSSFSFVYFVWFMDNEFVNLVNHKHFQLHGLYDNLFHWTLLNFHLFLSVLKCVLVYVIY